MSSAVNTFLGVLFIVVFLIGVTSRGALKGSDAFVLRWTVIALAIGFSAFVAWLRWKWLDSQSAATQATVGDSRANAPVRPIAQSSPPAPSPGPVPVRSTPRPQPLPTATQAVVFRQHFPPEPVGATLSFFGGAPVAPAGFQWPRTTASKPFTFLMQIDCAEVPASARLELLPDRGILYFFHDLSWGEPTPFRVLYEERVDKDAAPIQPPADLDRAYGDQAPHRWSWPRSLEDCPLLLPRWTFQPVVIELPPPSVDADEDEDAPVLWPGEKATAEALQAAQGEEVVADWFSIKDFAAPDGALIRPYPNYPHDWRAVQIASGLLIDSLSHTYRFKGTAARHGLSDQDRDALLIQTTEEASGWYTLAASHSPFATVPPAESNEFWTWLADKPWLARFVIVEAVVMSIEASLADSHEAAARIPTDVARRLHHRHALASRAETRWFAPNPDRMLAPPVDVQGNQWDRAKTHLLLLELSSNEALGHHFGEGVYQFWITPEDLKARRFDKVELTADAY